MFTLNHAIGWAIPAVGCTLALNPGKGNAGIGGRFSLSLFSPLFQP
jgi:hypothetical protein